MKINNVFGASIGVFMMGAASLAIAKPLTQETAAKGSDASETYVVPLPKAATLADNVVVGGTTQPAPPAQPAPVVVQPGQQPVAAQPAVIDTEPSHKSVVHADVSPPHNYMATIAGSAFMGAVAGALIGGAIYYLGSQTHPYNIAYWAAGGVLVGTGVGLTQIMIQESRASQATAMASDPAPTYRLSLFRREF
jgi:hypothetical protein